ncbi:MAG: sugar ABC transporter permease [Candidatus Eisenbacteria bacterium]|uniref:Sugar ABC transporter permease n=1 Tax=Eiseniibacteriota bacterium TaxID=2212470 RepID=A0A7Y2E546_UNCEI|nr:sugar ABC transporter permease [Candidatus Eisenbacteria bacterium]
MSAKKNSPIQSILLHVLLVIVALAAIYPILLIIGISLRPGNQLYSTSLAIIPENATFEAYRVMLFEKDFLLWLRNSAIVSLTVTVIGVGLAATAGYAFSRFRFPGHRVTLTSFLLTQMFPATMLLLPLYLLLQKLRLLDSLFGLVIAYVTTALPFCVWTMKGYYDTIPRDLEEAAMIDGLSPLGAFVRIVLPLSTPALTITALFSFMAAWSEFIVARVVLQSSELFTLPLGLESLAGTFQTEWANYAAGSVLVCIPVVILFMLLNRFLVSGLTLGGVKG